MFLVKVSNIDIYLTHFWPICNGQMLDHIGSAHMTQGSLTIFTSNRFGNANSSLALNGGWTRVPSGVYFDTLEFTVALWVYPQTVGIHARVFDFSNGAPSDNVLLCLDSGGDKKPFFQINKGSTFLPGVSSSVAWAQNQWQHLAATFDGHTLKIFINGTETASGPINYKNSSIVRNSNYFGLGPFGNEMSLSYLDDLRFFNKSLSQLEIVDLLNKNEFGNSFDD